MKATFAVLLLGLAALPAFAVNFSGKWAIQPAPGARGGRGGPTILVINQVGNEVSGTIAGRVDAGTGSPVNTEVLGGKVEGDVLSFYVWTGTDQPAKTTYRGTMSAGGDEIQFSITGGRGAIAGQTVPPATPPGGPQQMTAKRAK